MGQSHFLKLKSELENSEERRIAFYDSVYNLILNREAFSPIKWVKLGTAFENECERLNLKDEFKEADNETKLLRALHKLNYARKDRHLKLDASKDFMRADEMFRIPLRFYPDMSNESEVFFYVANLSELAADKDVSRGDYLVSIDGIPIDEYIDLLSPYLRYSTHRHMVIKEIPAYLGSKSYIYGPELLQSDQMKIQLYQPDDEETYEVILSYEYAENINWIYPPILERDREDNQIDKHYYEDLYHNFGFEKVYDDDLNCALYVNHTNELALIEWYHFEETRGGVQNLMLEARNQDILNYDVIVDATHSGGGGESALFLQVLAESSFKTTFGNVRVSDKEFAKKHISSYSSNICNWVLDAINSNKEFTSNEPFKLQLFPRGSDGIMYPANIRFKGNKVVLFFTLGGSNLDQFAAMIADNPQLNIHTIGMPCGGYSNTWEWGETLTLPNGTNTYFEWDVGHTIRPNGEILEGNPAIPKELFPFTVDNYRHYFEDLLQKGISFLTLTAINQHEKSPMNFNLKVSNPVRDIVGVRFDLDSYSAVEILILDMSGRPVHQIEEKNYPAGLNQVFCDTTNLLKGAYLLILKTRNGMDSKKIIKI